MKWKITALLLAVFSVSEASAHARWSMDGSTPGRTDNANLKQGPCGGVARTNNPAVFKAGSTVTLNWESTIYHKGYFIISFSPAADEGFEKNVLIANIPERTSGGAGAYSAEITLPDEPCDDCTLQMIQVMLDRNPPTNYYSCADIRLVADVPADNVPPQPVTNLGTRGVVPNVVLSWLKPAEDYAGALVLRGDASPQAGTLYVAGDTIGQAEVLYAGAAQTFELMDAVSNELISVYAFDMAHNYSTQSTVFVPPYIAPTPLGLSLNYSQEAHGRNDVFEADGPVTLQGLVLAPTDDMAVSWSMNVTQETALESSYDPLGAAGQVVEVTMTVTDPDPNGDREESVSTSFEVKPYSYYQPKLEFVQNGQVVSEFITEDGEAEVRIAFAGDTPDDSADWRVEWQHAIEGASEEGLSLRFDPSGQTSQELSVLVYSPTALAAPELAARVPIVKPIKLGSLGGWSLMLLAGLLATRQLFARQRLQARA